MISDQAPAVDALLQAAAAVAVKEEPLENASTAAAVEAVEEKSAEDASTTEAATEAVTTLGDDLAESGEEESTVEREAARVVETGVPARRSAQGTGLEQYEKPVSAQVPLTPPVPATGQSLPVTAFKPADTPSPPVVIPPKPPRAPKALRSAMNSMAKAVVGRRKPGKPSTV